jgi:asparagine synthase (glutamine-hydrolysing)
MCGVAGVVCLGSSCGQDDHVRLVTGMCDLQAHRGPDHTGVVSLGNVCLGTNRLSIIDLTTAAHMPMSTEDGRWWIAYNGEVYNFPALRAELIRAGHVFRSRSDSEVVLRAFGEWGERSLERFVGMFAFAIYDQRTETLTLARDRFGKKPLYHMCRGGHLWFASEMKALMPFSGQLQVNQQRLLEWTLYRSADCGSSATLVDDIFALQPGHVMRIVRGALESPRRYYAAESRVDVETWKRLARAPMGAVVAEIEGAIVRSVGDRLVSDVPLGTLCSGGIDSGLVTAVCARHLPRVAAFNVSVEGYPALNENRYARTVARALGIDLLTYPLTADAYRHSLVRAVYHSDFPLTHPNSVAFLLVSEFARKNGVTILLSGEGADELFGGYSQRYRRYRQFLRLERLLAVTPARIRKALALAGCAALGIPLTRFNEYEGLHAHAVVFLDKYVREGLHERCADAYGFVPNEIERGVLAAMLADLSIFLQPLLRRLDRMSMAASLECRVPFLDHRLVDLAINLPLAHRLRGATDKWLLKRIAARYLPRTIVDRPKSGFPLPVLDYLSPLARHEFFRDGFCEEELGLDRRGLQARVSNWRQSVDGFFSLLTLEIWGRLFVRREGLQRVTDTLLAPGREARQPTISRGHALAGRAAGSG